MTRAFTAVGALMLALASCQGPSTEPLDPPGDGGEYCQPPSKDGRLSFGAGYPINRADFDITVTRVELVDPVGMELVGTRVIYVPIKGPSTAMGAVPGWPPYDFIIPELKTAFEKSRPIDGAVIPPSKKTSPSFAIGVKATPGAHSGPLRVTYTHGDDEWTWTGTITFRVGTGESC